MACSSSTSLTIVCVVTLGLSPNCRLCSDPTANGPYCRLGPYPEEDQSSSDCFGFLADSFLSSLLDFRLLITGCLTLPQRDEIAYLLGNIEIQHNLARFQTRHTTAASGPKKHASVAFVDSTTWFANPPGY